MNIHLRGSMDRYVRKILAYDVDHCQILYDHSIHIQLRQTGKGLHQIGQFALGYQSIERNIDFAFEFVGKVQQPRQIVCAFNAGADAVIGMHSHCMQGVEMYNGKFIAYSLGNFTFSSYTLSCAMAVITVDGTGELGFKLYPMMQRNNMTYICESEELVKQLSLLRSLAINADVADDFTVTQK